MNDVIARKMLLYILYPNNGNSVIRHYVTERKNVKNYSKIIKFHKF